MGPEIHLLTRWGDAALTAAGFFWKAAWAFVLGYAVSAMIQAFVPKAGLTRRMGRAGVRSVGLATAFGAASSSCSFAALATARSLVGKGAHFIAAVAFMFASTNLVVELGILIVIFLGWGYLAAEIVGGLVLIAISSVLIALTYPRAWLDAARSRAEEIAGDQPDDFDWRARIRSREGWEEVGKHFVMEWGMVWEDVLIGFTAAGALATFVPDGFWRRLFLADIGGLPSWIVAVENAVVGPLVAAMTFIGSMGNIPLATVLASSGVLFAGIIAFIYSDLMVPPLVRVNAKYYGWRVSLYIAGVMFVSIVATALLLNGGFALAGATPRGHGRPVAELTRFALDYTFWLDLAFAVIAAVLVALHRRGRARAGRHAHHGAGGGGFGVKRAVVGAVLVLLVGGAVAAAFTR